MEITLLGPVRAFAADGAPVALGGTRPRMLLGRLALAAGKTVSADALIEDIWGAEPLVGAANTLHALVHRLRRALPSAGLVESSPVGYRLALPADSVDVHRFEALAARGRRELAAGEAESAAATLADALALWHGAALADVRAAPYAETAATRLAELRTAAREDRFDALLRLGRQAEVLADLEAALAEHPLRERLAALRMRALCAAGRQSEALAGYEQIRARLAEELGVDPGAELRDTHLAVLRGELDRPRSHTGAAPGRLPARLTSFLGRADELKLLAELLDTARLVTLTGPGGVGKTRLATEAAAAHRAYRGGRLWLVPLAGVEHPDGVAGAILGTLSTGPGLRTGAPAEPLARVAELLGGDEAVLVLDNCEHLVAEVARIAQHLLEQRPRLRILATSRESLDILGETLCRLDPLPVPPEHAHDVAESAAVRLFLDRATAVRPGFTLDPSTVDSIAEVVRCLDGLPLALELAAARLRSMTIGQIARRLDDRFRLLDTGNRAALPRQRTLRAVIEWSWDLLTARERVLLRRLSIFPAHTETEAVEAICADGDTLAPGDVGYLLGSLVDKSLVQQHAEGYRMLASIRAFAAGELAAAGERETVRDRFTAHFAALAAGYEPLARSHQQPAVLAGIAAEYDNLVFALRSALDSRDGEATARLLGLLHWYWYAARYDARTESFLAEALTLGDALPADARTAYTAMDALIGQNSPTTDPDRVRALLADCTHTGAYQRYPLLLTATLPVAQHLGLHDLVAAELAAVRGGSDAWANACVSILEGSIAGDRGDWTGVAAARARAAAEFAGTGDRLWTAVSLAALAEVHGVAGDHAAAVAGLERAIALTAGLGSQDEVSYRVGLAAQRARTGDLAAAARDLDLAEHLTRARGLGYMEIEVLRGRAEIHRRAGEYAQSALALDRLAEVLGQLSIGPPERLLAPGRMALLLSTGETTAARALLPTVVTVALANNEPAPAAQQLAWLRCREGDLPGAATALGLSQVLRGAFDQGDPELRDLIAELTDRLGESGYLAAYRAGAGLPRPDALRELALLGRSAAVSTL
ncbi:MULTISPECIES: BTAD domain-containing putative transcriptional regulator [unclassified Crossiella]|uniref:BTAD domain-containing putative transcriptional regulator n=1 Tax=unclassified Crossiella TaxID=2620835 RepID=UPI001FFED400|nr:MULTISPECIES: BTAD domain-containing putative transcriptional regulator [unclassified Crossiella]MCK2243592.1 winged helix-turn-helix domain-containing protein [Crossiella sp. S99.2]MCK2257450.1 winged helix-turn-helix domain-containing protein [Crossiella sp. S99.1]